MYEMYRQTPFWIDRGTEASPASSWTETRRGWRFARRRTSSACVRPPPARSTSTMSRWHLILHRISMKQMHAVISTNFVLFIVGTRDKHFGSNRSGVQVRYRDVERGQDWNCRSGKASLFELYLKQAKCALFKIIKCEMETLHVLTVCFRWSAWRRAASTVLFLTPDRECSLENASLTSR